MAGGADPRSGAPPPRRGDGASAGVFALGGAVPALDPTAWVAPGAVLVGRVRLDARASVWFGAVLRGDDEAIVVGEAANVQDGVIVHADPGRPVSVGTRASVGHQAVLHGCGIGAGSLVGIGARVLNGARVGAGTIVGAGAVVPPGMVCPEGVLVLGVPARVVRPLRDEERAAILEVADRYVARCARYREGLCPPGSAA